MFVWSMLGEMGDEIALHRSSVNVNSKLSFLEQEFWYFFVCLFICVNVTRKL